uniref:FYVE-type domain-containing protein n=1 Tax=Peronospora matthiolae TaxID=2874970 RepID=A0AAV1U1R2_9STRA
MATRNNTRLLKPTSSMQSMSGVLSLQPAPLTSATLSRAVEEDLESQARASLSLFGFGLRDSVNWSPVSASAGAAASAASSTETPGTGGAIKVRVMERVCPIGTNALLWSIMNSLANGGEGGDDLATGSADLAASHVNGGTGVNGSGALESDASDWDAASSAAGLDNGFASKVLQQYLVKCVALLPSSIEEAVDFLVRSDRDDMEPPMKHLVGVRTSSSAFVYRRKKKPLRRSNNNNSNGRSNNGGDGVSQRMASQTCIQDCDSDSSYSETDADLDDDLQPITRISSRNFTSGRARGTQNGDSLEDDRPVTPANSGPYLSPSYMDDYRAEMANSGHQGNLSIKWVVGEKSSRMFASRTTYCLLDYECILVNDWDENADPSPMYVRTLQSSYSPHCQAWLDEVGSKPTDLQPTGFMVRQARHRDGYVEVQFVASILEKAQLPMLSRRAKLRQLCAKIARLEEVLTKRRLSQSLLVHAPHWVHNRDRLGCRICDAKFGLSRRRHHCRLCGEICCFECCPKMDVALPDVGSTSVRVCIGCVQKRRKSCDLAESASSASTMASTLSPTNTACAETLPPPMLGSAVPSPSDHCLTFSSSHSAASGSFTMASGLGERKHSLASSVFLKMKSSSLS